MEGNGYASRAQLIELLGAEGAQQLIALYGGRRLWVPEDAASQAYIVLTRDLGDDVARKLRAAWGGMQVTLPLALVPLRERILILLGQDLSYRAIADRLGTTEVYVRQVASAHKKIANADRDTRRRELSA